MSITAENGMSFALNANSMQRKPKTGVKMNDTQCSVFDESFFRKGFRSMISTVTTLFAPMMVESAVLMIAASTEQHVNIAMNSPNPPLSINAPQTTGNASLMPVVGTCARAEILTNP